MASMLEQLRVVPGNAARIADRDPNDMLGLDRDRGKDEIKELSKRLDVLQHRLYAEGTRGLLLVLQGLDASGKDGVIRSVLDRVSPQGVRVVSFRVPTVTELAHDYLWRVHIQLPARGELVVFNRSHYEDVVAVRMHHLAPEETWKRRPGHIRDWERMLTDEGTSIVKVFLNVSKDEQRKRLQERIDDPEKRWKFRGDDVDVWKHYDKYIAAYEETLTETSTEWAPWYVVPADHNWVKSLAVAQLLVDELERMDPELPPPEPGIEGRVL
jgi:PPK2 family polyphosphate:nucleotide phosphotransferase